MNHELPEPQGLFQRPVRTSVTAAFGPSTWIEASLALITDRKFRMKVSAAFRLPSTSCNTGSGLAVTKRPVLFKAALEKQHVGCLNDRFGDDLFDDG